jgi:hypothetical protein
MKLTSFIAMAALALAACSSDLGSVSGDDDDDVSAGPDAGDSVDPDAAPEVEQDGRVDLGLQAEWKFKEGAGGLIADTGAVGPALDWSIQDPLAVQWIPGGGINITQPTIIKTITPPTKIHAACTAANQVTTEAWIRPAGVNQAGPARILTYSIDTANRNFTLGQANAAYNYRLRTSESDLNGTPATLSETGFTGGLQHVVITRDPAQTIMYIDGEIAGTQALGGDFALWDSTYEMALGNEITLDRPWRGEIFLAAVYCRSLSQLEVQQNFEAGY